MLRKNEPWREPSHRGNILWLLALFHLCGCVFSCASTICSLLLLCAQTYEWYPNVLLRDDCKLKLLLLVLLLLLLQSPPRHNMRQSNNNTTEHARERERVKEIFRHSCKLTRCRCVWVWVCGLLVLAILHTRTHSHTHGFFGSMFSMDIRTHSFTCIQSMCVAFIWKMRRTNDKRRYKEKNDFRNNQRNEKTTT